MDGWTLRVYKNKSPGHGVFGLYLALHDLHSKRENFFDWNVWSV